MRKNDSLTREHSPGIDPIAKHAIWLVSTLGWAVSLFLAVTAANGWMKAAKAQEAMRATCQADGGILVADRTCITPPVIR